MLFFLAEGTVWYYHGLDKGKALVGDLGKSCCVWNYLGDNHTAGATK